MFSEGRSRPRLYSTSRSQLWGVSPGTFVSTFGSIRVAVVRRVFLRILLFPLGSLAVSIVQLCVHLRDGIFEHHDHFARPDRAGSMSNLILYLLRSPCCTYQRLALPSLLFRTQDWCYEDSAGISLVSNVHGPRNPVFVTRTSDT